MKGDNNGRLQRFGFQTGAYLGRALPVGERKKYQADFKLDAIVLRNVVALTMAGDVLINAKTCLVQIADNRTPEQMKTIIEALWG